MLRRFRIEVEEETAEQCVAALWKYEHALVLQEVRRYRDLWPITLMAASQPQSSDEPIEHIEADVEEEYPTPDQPWDTSRDGRHWYNDQLGREVTEEVIEYDESIPGYRGRRVVAFVRVDMRSHYADGFIFFTDPSNAANSRAPTLGATVAQIEVRP